MASTRLSVSGVLPAELYERVISLLSSYSDSGCPISVEETLLLSSNAAPATTATTTRDDVRLIHKIERGDDESWTLETASRAEAPRLTPDFVARVVVDVPLSVLPTESNTGRARDKALAFVSALGYKDSGSTVRTKGVKFTRSHVDILLLRFYDDNDKILRPKDAVAEPPWLVTVTSQFAIPRADPSSASSSRNQQSSSSSAQSTGGGGTPTPGTPSQHAQSSGPSGQQAGAGAGGSSDASTRANRARAIRETKQLLRGLVDLERGDV